MIHLHELCSKLRRLAAEPGGATRVDYSIAAALVSIIILFVVTKFAGPAVAG